MRNCAVSPVHATFWYSSSMSTPSSTWDTDQRATFLASVRLFQQLSAAVRQQIASRFTIRHIPQGEFVFLEGRPATAFNVLATGRIKVIRETAGGQEVILRQIKPGDIFGAAGGWGQPVYPASAVAQENATVLQLSSTIFQQLLRSEPDFAVAVVAELGFRLREAEARIRDLQTERVECRIARTLLRLAEHQHSPTIPLSRQDLAALAGTTLSTASRTLSAWDHQGILRAQRQRVAILDYAALRTLAELPPSPS